MARDDAERAIVGGKTTVLAGRIAFLIRERGFAPSSILAVSFTTEAARALRAQVGRQLGAAASDISIYTPCAGSTRHRHVGKPARL